jgi:alpha amylase-like protein
MAPDSALVVGSRDGELSLRLDSGSGLPTALVLADGESIALSTSATLSTEGREVFRPLFGMTYADTVDHTDFKLVEQEPRRRLDGTADVYRVVTSAGDWTVTWEYTFRRSSPRLAVGVELTPPDRQADSTLRDLRLELTVQLSEPQAWQVEAPGNELRPGIALDTLTEAMPISPATGVMGSTGLVAVHHPGLPRTLVFWPLCRTEIGSLAVCGGDTLRLELDTGLAGRLTALDSLRYDAIHVDVLDTAWEQTRDRIPSWYAGLGLTTPPDRPEWVKTASIYEVQLGFSPFSGGVRYEPYPDVPALRADLDRIRSLGYDTLQIMPRQPYPSYNVLDYADITTTYGDESQLRALVAECHARGMRVILDVLMHGVIDQEVMAKTADRVRASAFAARLGENTTRNWGTSPSALTATDVSWARHILDFEPYWSASPARHPLVDEHPEWFLRDSNQDIIGIYTKAFDATNPSWQEYFTAAMEELIRRLDIDGFRFDAPTYNDLPNWSRATQSRASYSPLGCLELFERLRPRLKRLKESLMLYTEPSGVLFREAMDITYNYEEQWLIPMVLGSHHPDIDLGVRDARELAAWFRDRNAVLPPGSLIAHHVDSHDTFWWPLPGEKWRREQHGLDATRALNAILALSGGGYMTFVGGEDGLEPDIRRIHKLRALPAIRHGAVDYDAVTVDQDSVYAVVRRIEDQSCVVLVNLSDAPISTACSLDLSRLGSPDEVSLYDAWAETALEWDGSWTLAIELDPYQITVITISTEPNGDNR